LGAPARPSKLIFDPITMKNPGRRPLETGIGFGILPNACAKKSEWIGIQKSERFGFLWLVNPAG